jgi:hypothetical protein
MTTLKKILNAPKKLAAIEQLAYTRGNTGGLRKRIDENRELLELLLQDAPDLIEKRPWLIGWIEDNDHFFVQLDALLGKPDQHGRLVPPRAWPLPRDVPGA